MVKKTFETSLSKLEKLTNELESGSLSLEASLKKFDEGIQLATFCDEQLNEAKAKVEILLEKDGKLTAEPFNNDE
ncbi:MAG: exodeoxyribonuclease VII small subunit [Desulfotalea sp.]